MTLRRKHAAYLASGIFSAALMAAWGWPTAGNLINHAAAERATAASVADWASVAGSTESPQVRETVPAAWTGTDVARAAAAAAGTRPITVDVLPEQDEHLDTVLGGAHVTWRPVTVTGTGTLVDAWRLAEQLSNDPVFTITSITAQGGTYTVTAQAMSVELDSEGTP